jgi:hypothetical protein
LQRTGSPTGSTRKTPAQLFWPKVQKTEDCWLWLGSKNAKGYGVHSIKGDNVLAHRFVFALVNGAILDGMQIDHTCYTRECVNPSHLRAVTYYENQENREGANANNTTSGKRGISWASARNKWLVQVSSRGKRYNGGYFERLEDAETAAIALRNRILTHNDMDRVA